MQALNELVTLYGGTGTYIYDIQAYNAICTLVGAASGHKYVKDALATLVGTELNVLTSMQNVEVGSPLYRTLLIDSDNRSWSTLNSNPYGGGLYRSDDFITYTEMVSFGNPNKITGVFELADGELLIVVSIQAISNLAQCGIFKTQNNRTSVVQVIVPRNNNVSFVADWGVSISGANVVISEYGTFSEDATRGSRYLYYSTDNGSTFTAIFDIVNAPVDYFPHVDGWKQAHIHCCLYDSVYDRIWMSTGDGDNSKTLGWSDDFGTTWNSINLFGYNGQNLQLISMGETETGVICGSDNINGGIYKIPRTGKEVTPVLQKIYSYDFVGITHLTGLMKLVNATLIIPVSRGDHKPVSHDARHAFILAYNNSRIWKIWQDEEESAYPVDGMTLNIINKDRFIYDLVNTKYSADPTSDDVNIAYVPCRYSGEFYYPANTLSTPLTLIHTFDINTVSVLLEWTDNNIGAQYEVYSSVNGGADKLLTTTAVGATSYTDATIKQNATTVYKIRAKKAALYSDFKASEVINIPLYWKTDQTVLTTVNMQVIVLAAGKSITFDWGDGTTTTLEGGTHYSTLKDYAATGIYNIELSGDIDGISTLMHDNHAKDHGSIANWYLWNGIGNLTIGANALTGDLSNWVIPSTVQILNLNYALYTGSFPHITPSAIPIAINASYSRFSRCDSTEFRKGMTLFNLSNQQVPFIIAEINKLFKNLADYYEFNTPTSNCTFELTGANMGIPTGGNANVDIVRLKGYYTAAGFTATVNVNT